MSAGSLAAEAVNQVQSRLDFAANALVLRADSMMTRTLLDRLA